MNAVADKMLFDSAASVQASVGRQLGETEWVQITQERINQFADATGDHQWIHVDPEQARNGPFGACVAHGYLTLSLIPYLADQALHMRAVRMGVNYGLNRVRFTAPVRAGKRVRARLTPLQVEDIPGGWQLTWKVVVEIEGSDKPACVAESLVRNFGAPA